MRNEAITSSANDELKETEIYEFLHLGKSKNYFSERTPGAAKKTINHWLSTTRFILIFVLIITGYQCMDIQYSNQVKVRPERLQFGLNL